MSEVFQCDAQSNQLKIVVPNTIETEVVRTNPLQPPYQTCKAKVIAIVGLTPGGDQIDIYINIYRNPDAENLLVALADIQIPPLGNDIILVVGCTDQIPDSRSVEYKVTVNQTGGVVDGQAYMNYVEATLLSG